MATDKSDPRTGLIFQVGILSIVTLLGSRAFLQAYFDRAERAEISRKLVTPEALVGLRAEEKRELGAGSMPIEQAMQLLATKGRSGSPAVMPSASLDKAPLEGWTKMPGQVPATFGMAPPEPPPGPPPSSIAAPPASGAPSAAPSAAPPVPHPPNQPPHQP
jgi:hypothetical protein